MFGQTTANPPFGQPQVQPGLAPGLAPAVDHGKETENVLTSFSNAISYNQENNKFRGFCYNRFPEEVKKNEMLVQEINGGQILQDQIIEPKTKQPAVVFID